MRRKPPLGRLTKRPQFVAAASGRRFHTERMTVQGRPRDSSEPATGLRFGLTVTKREGHATERNRIKRRLREAVRVAGAGFAEVPVDVVVIGRRQALAAEYASLVDDLRRALHVVTKPRPDRGAGRDASTSATRHPPSTE